jgi:hypothetical protein
MTEAEWLACTEPKSMLEVLRGTVSDRKVRLFACACCRRVWHLLSDAQSRQTIEVAENFADGRATEAELEESQRAAARIRHLSGTVAKWTAAAMALTGARMVIDVAGQIAASPPGKEYDPSLWATENQNQASLLREIFGRLPFRPLTFDSARRTGTVTTLAQAIYDERAFKRLPILADALEDAGCDNADILAHCREPGEHVRGCWVVDLLLGKS